MHKATKAFTAGLAATAVVAPNAHAASPKPVEIFHHPAVGYVNNNEKQVDRQLNGDVGRLALDAAKLAEAKNAYVQVYATGKRDKLGRAVVAQTTVVQSKAGGSLAVEVDTASPSPKYSNNSGNPEEVKFTSTSPTGSVSEVDITQNTTRADLKGGYWTIKNFFSDTKTGPMRVTASASPSGVEQALTPKDVDRQLGVVDQMVSDGMDGVPPSNYVDLFED